MNKSELILQAHPIFNTIKKCLIISETAEEVTHSGDTREVTFIFHISGIFILNQRSFSKQLQVVSFIPLIDLQKITVTEKCIEFESEKTKITIKHKKFIEIASKVITVHNVLFYHESVELTVVSEEKIKNQIDGFFFDYVPESMLADRFFACVLHIPTHFDSNILKETYENLLSIKNRFSISSETIDNPYIAAIIASISYDADIQEIELESISMAVFIPYFNIITKNSQSCDRIVMKNVDFTRRLKYIEKLFGENDLFKASEFVFKECDFKSKNSIPFFESFSSYQSNIESLTFDDCSFNSETLDALFQSLFFSNCFHNLQSISISGIELEEITLLVFQLLCCGWVLEKHCLQSLSVTRSNIKLEKLVPQILQLDSGFTELELSGNAFLEPLPIKQQLNFQHITKFVFKDVEFGKGCLISLLQQLSAHEKMFELDLTGAIMDEESWKDFYENIEGIKMPTLQSFIWDKNEIDETTAPLLCDFLMGQKSLTDLSISFCISKLERDSVLPTFIELMQSKTFEKFRMKANYECALGPSLSSLLLAVIRNGKIKDLDISGQAVGEKCLLSIAQEMPGTLTSINFDGFSPSSAETFLSVCESFVSKVWMKNVVWPASDVKPTIAKSHSQFRNEMTRRIQHMKTQYSLKFGEEFENSTKSTQHQNEEFHSPTREESIFTNSNCGCIYENILTMGDFVELDNETLNLIRECEKVRGVEPINQVLSDIDEHTQIPELVSIIQSLDK